MWQNRRDPESHMCAAFVRYRPLLSFAGLFCHIWASFVIRRPHVADLLGKSSMPLLLYIDLFSEYMPHICPSIPHIRPSMSHIRPPMSRICPSMSYIRPSMSHICPSMSHIRPPMSHICPSMSYIRPFMTSPYMSHMYPIYVLFYPIHVLIHPICVLSANLKATDGVSDKGGSCEV